MLARASHRWLRRQWIERQSTAGRAMPLRRCANRGSAFNLDEAPEIDADSGAREVAAIDDALKRLPDIDPRKGKVVELRFFGGLSVEETAAVSKIPPQSVMRDWTFARALLLPELAR